MKVWRGLAIFLVMAGLAGSVYAQAIRATTRLPTIRPTFMQPPCPEATHDLRCARPDEAAAPCRLRKRAAGGWQRNAPIPDT